MSVIKALWYIFTTKHMLEDENDTFIDVVHSHFREYAQIIPAKNPAKDKECTDLPIDVVFLHS